MTLFWGAWEYAGSNGMRVGVDTYNMTTVTTSSTTFSLTMDCWTENQYNYNDPQVLTRTGSSPGSLSFTNGQPTGSQTKRQTITTTYTYPSTSYGTSPGTLRTDWTISGTYNGVTPTQYSSVPIPARPYAAPNVPTSVASTRNSDTKTTITWNSPATSQRPVTNYTLQVRTYTGATWGGWSTFYTGTSRSVAVTTSVNHSYQYQVRANNSVGSSAYVAAPQTYTTPSAPTNVHAVPNGNAIDVTWGTGSYTSSAVTHKIERSADGGAWTSVATLIPRATLLWTDTSPGASNRYRVATVTSSHGGLSSAWVEADVVVVNDCWVWDGESEIPANMTLWNGVAEVPLSIDSKVFVR